MNTKMIIELLILQIILILSLVFFVIFLLIFRRNIKLQKKFDKYTISSSKTNDISFFDRVSAILNRLIINNSKLLKRFNILNSYGKKYDKHISFDELKNKDGMYFVSLKFILGMIVFVLYLITRALQYKEITISGILLSFVLGFFVLDLFIYIDYKKKRKEVEEDLLKAIIVMNNTFKTGKSTMQAVEIVKNELTGAISDEFKKIYLDITYGLSIETVFERFYERIKLEDAKYISSSLTLLNKTGGNIIKVFSSIEKEFYNRKKLDNELKTMTSSSNFVFKMLLFVPFAVYLLIFALNKDYFSPLFVTPLGKMILIFIVVLYVFYILLIKKVMRIDV